MLSIKLIHHSIKDFEVIYKRLFGQVIDVKIIRKNVSGIQFKETNYGFIHMKNSDQADNALNNFNKISQQPWIISTYNDKSKMQIKNPFGLQIFQKLPDICQKPNFELFPIQEFPKPEITQLQQLLQGGLQVRELFVGNLNHECDQKSVDASLRIYGEIEQVDFFQKIPPFAFVRFKKVESAQKAIDDQQTIAVVLSSLNLRINFADHEKRPAIVGDLYGYENPNELSNFIYIGVHGSIQLPTEKQFKQEIQRYAEVKQLFIKQSNFQLNGQRSFILAELENIEQVRKVYKKYMKEDRSSDRRKRLGDLRCDVQMVLKPKIRQVPLIPQQRLYNQNPPKFINLGYANPPIIEKQQNNQTNFVDILSQMIDKNQEKQIEEEHKNTFWSGFFTRVGVDATILEGQEPNFNDFNLNVSHRIKIEEILKKNVQCIVIFTPSNETQVKQFLEYIQYFTEKQRAGVIQIRNLSLYILPKIEQFKELQELKSDQILGIFCDQNQDLNRINLQLYLNKKNQPQQNDDIEQENLNNEQLDLLNSNNLQFQDFLHLIDKPEIQNIIKYV